MINENLLKLYLRNNIPFEKMKILMKDFGNHNFKNTVNIYIDFESLIKPLLNDLVIEECMNEYEIETLVFIFMGLIINTAGHYRHYFYRYHETFTNIYFIYGSKKNIKYLLRYEDYKKDFYEKYIDVSDKSRIIHKVIKNIKKIIPFFSYIYFIDSLEYDKNITIKYIAETQNVNVIHNLILTNDHVLYQYLNILKNVSIINLKGQHSGRILRSNLISNILDSENTLKMSYDLYANILTMTGYPKYNIPGLNKTSYKKAISILHKGHIDGFIKNAEYYDQDEFIRDLECIKNLKDKDLSCIKLNFKLLNIKYQYEKFFNKTIFHNIVDENILNKYNYKFLKEINNLYFTFIPLNLDYLLEGSDYKF